MPTQSAGVLLYRKSSGSIEVLLVHPGGPFWQNRDDHAWSIPKGEFSPGETPLEAAKRELQEETGIAVQGELESLGSVAQSDGKIVHVWATHQDNDLEAIRSNTFELEWPPRSGRLCTFPEVDRAEWFVLPLARQKLIKGQLDFLGRLCVLTGTS